MPTETSKKPTARERLLAAADELFYAEGIQSVGIDRVIEKAGVAKASLYHCFSSKEELVGAYLEGRGDWVASRLTKAMDAADTPRAKILALFDAQAKMFERPGYKGCAFVAASTEAPEGGIVETATRTYRKWIRDTFIGLARDAGAGDPALLGRQLHLLYDGASLSVRIEHRHKETAHAARTAAELLLAAALSE